MYSHSQRTQIFLLLSLLTGASVLLLPRVTLEDEALPFYLLGELADSDDVEESSESKLVATREPTIDLCDHSGWHAIFDEFNHQIDGFLVHNVAPRAPPLLG